MSNVDRWNDEKLNQDFLNKSVAASEVGAAGQSSIVTLVQPTVEMSGYEFDISYDLSDSLALGVSVGHVEGDNPASDLEYNVSGQNDSSSISLTHRGMLGKIPAITVLRANTVGDDIMSERALNCGTIPLYEGCAQNGGTNQITNPEYTLANLNINLITSSKPYTIHALAASPSRPARPAEMTGIFPNSGPAPTRKLRRKTPH